MSDNIAADLRAECARIIKRNFGHVPDAIGAIRVATVEKIQAYIERAEEAKANCTCAPVKGFDPYRRETRLDFEFKLRRFKRMNAEAA